MTEEKQYILENIKTLLLKGFSEVELHRLAEDNSKFNNLQPDLQSKATLRDLVNTIVAYTKRQILFEDLLAWAKFHNQGRYELHQPYRETDTPAVTDSTGKAVTPPSPKQIWNITHPRNPYFAGRQQHLALLRQNLKSLHPTALTQAIKGLGGVGKTQLALEYAYVQRGEYTVTWWIRAQEESTLTSDYNSLALALGLAEKTLTDQNILQGIVYRWLAAHPGWLLIFDNAIDPETLKPYIPPQAQGHILITSRNQHWRDITALEVKPFAPPEANQFWHKRLGITEDSSTLAETLGHLPLALEHAAAYIQATGLSIADYLTRFQTHRQQLLNTLPPHTDYGVTIATTWQLSLQRLTTDNPAAVPLLYLCAFFGPDNIPRSLLTNQAELLPTPLNHTLTDPLAFDQAIADLRRYSLIEAQSGLLSVHRLVQAVIRGQLTETARATWVTAVTRILDTAYPFDDHNLSTWAESEPLTPHILAIAERLETAVAAWEPLAHLLQQAGWYLTNQANYNQAQQLIEQGLKIRQHHLGANHPDTATSLNNMGGVLKAQGHLAEARGYFERSLAISEEVLGAKHPTTAKSLNNMGAILREQRDWVEARRCLERALVIQREVLDEHHPDTGQTLLNLGVVLHELRQFPLARTHLKKGVRILEASLGPDHPDTQMFKRNLKRVGVIGGGSKRGPGSAKRKTQKQQRKKGGKGKKGRK